MWKVKKIHLQQKNFNQEGAVKMDAIELMMEEHKYILRMLKVVRKACFKV